MGPVARLVCVLVCLQLSAIVLETIVVPRQISRITVGPVEQPIRILAASWVTLLVLAFLVQTGTAELESAVSLAVKRRVLRAIFYADSECAQLVESGQGASTRLSRAATTLVGDLVPPVLAVVVLGFYLSVRFGRSGRIFAGGLLVHGAVVFLGSRLELAAAPLPEEAGLHELVRNVDAVRHAAPGSILYGRAWSKEARGAAVARARLLHARNLGLLFGASNVCVLLAATLHGARYLERGPLVSFVIMLVLLSEYMGKLCENIALIVTTRSDASAFLKAVPPTHDAAARPRRPMPHAPAIRLDGVSIRRGGRTLVRELSLHIPHGHHLQIVGPSGCGKSTLLRAMIGRLPVTEGRISYGDLDLADIDPSTFFARAAYVGQDVALFNMSLLENLRLGCDPPPSEGDVEGFLARHGFEKLLPPLTVEVTREGDSLSKGQQKLVQVVRALLQKPDVLFLDEPTTGLDAALRARVERSLAEVEGTLIFISHNPVLAVHHPRLATLTLRKEGGDSVVGAPAPSEAE